MRQKKASPAQVKAGQAFAAAGRASQHRARVASIQKTGKPPPRSKKQKQASLKFAAAGRAAQARARAHLKPLPKKKPALPLDGAGLHDKPVCAAVAIAENLFAVTGVAIPDTEILALAARAEGGTLNDFLCAAVYGGPLGGWQLSGFWPYDEDLYAPGLIYGVQFRAGYHAVLATHRGMLSWGRVLPLLGTPREAWHLEWDMP